MVRALIESNYFQSLKYETAIAADNPKISLNCLYYGRDIYQKAHD